MGWTKQNLIDKAYEQIGLASYVFDISPEMYQSALMSLDAMMGTWNALGIRLGYPMSSGPSDTIVSLATDTSLPDSAVEAVFMRLGIRLASERGKPVSGELKAAADSAYQALLNLHVDAGTMNFPCDTLAGAGNRYLSGAFGRVFLDGGGSGGLNAGQDAKINLRGKGRNQ
jgi:hypothetical protein